MHVRIESLLEPCHGGIERHVRTGSARSRAPVLLLLLRRLLLRRLLVLVMVLVVLLVMVVVVVVVGRWRSNGQRHGAVVQGQRQGIAGGVAGVAQLQRVQHGRFPARSLPFSWSKRLQSSTIHRVRDGPKMRHDQDKILTKMDQRWAIIKVIRF